MEVLEDATFREELLIRATALADNVSPRSTRIIKRQLLESPFQTLAEATRIAEGEVAGCILSEDFREGVAHYLEKRPAKFTGR